MSFYGGYITLAKVWHYNLYVEQDHAEINAALGMFSACVNGSTNNHSSNAELNEKNALMQYHLFKNKHNPSRFLSLGPQLNQFLYKISSLSNFWVRVCE